MATTADAVRAIRHVVQEHGDDRTALGRPADPQSIQWFGQLLGWTWPPSYLDVLAKHDGVIVHDAIVLSFLKSVEIFLVYRDLWHRPDGYWPVGGDGCGNYFVLDLGQRDAAGECPVGFIDTMENAEEPQSQTAANYASFVVEKMREQCMDCECTELSQQE